MPKLVAEGKRAKQPNEILLQFNFSTHLLACWHNPTTCTPCFLWMPQLNSLICRCTNRTCEHKQQLGISVSLSISFLGWYFSVLKYYINTKLSQSLTAWGWGMAEWFTTDVYRYPGRIGQEGFTGITIWSSQIDDPGILILRKSTMGFSARMWGQDLGPAAPLRVCTDFPQARELRSSVNSSVP